MSTLLEAANVTGEASPLLRRVQLVGYVVYFGFMGALTLQLVRGYDQVAIGWLVVVAALLGYAAADLASGLVHFLADNFGSPATPLLGPGFVLPFRQHHVDPLGITRHGFWNANANNALVTLPVLIPFVTLAYVERRTGAYHWGVFMWTMLLAVFLTNQTHKWAHMASPPRPVRWLQRAGVILSREHHDVHHTSPFNTHYCITVGVWNPLFERFRIFDRLERFIRRWVPGTDPRMRVDQEAEAAALAAAAAGTASIAPSALVAFTHSENAA